MALVTIYTPTYNRSKLLKRLYDSLIRQTCDDFIWMVVDDGSTDNTKELIESFQKNDNKFEIIYYYKENGGVHTARDFAYDHCDTELIFSVDSDDWLLDDAVKNIISFWKREGSEYYAGIFCPDIIKNKKVKTLQLPNIKYVTYQDLTYKYKFKYDKTTIIRSKIIKEIPHAPSFKGEKLVGEGFKWVQLPENNPFLIMNIPIMVREYQINGYTMNSYDYIFNNLNGYRASCSQAIKSLKFFKPRLKAYIGYIATSLLLKDKKFIKKSPYPFKTFILMPLGIFGLICLLIRRKILKKNNI